MIRSTASISLRTRRWFVSMLSKAASPQTAFLRSNMSLIQRQQKRNDLASGASAFPSATWDREDERGRFGDPPLPDIIEPAPEKFAKFRRVRGESAAPFRL